MRRIRCNGPEGRATPPPGTQALAPVLARAALAAGCDGIFMEVHENGAPSLMGRIKFR
jgi:3-deoxy-D-manno-octulosonic acid (KDO) 8-phosphate synthase